MGSTGAVKKLIKAVTILSNLPYLRATTPLRTKKWFGIAFHQNYR